MAKRGETSAVKKAPTSSRPSSTEKKVKPTKETVIYEKPHQEKQKTLLFPKIYRFITEQWKLILSGIISLVIIIGIVFQGAALYSNLQKEKKIEEERGRTEREITFWRNSLAKYKDSRDIYLKIASLEYRLGNIEKARFNLRKALEIDPNSREGREMEKQIGL